MTQTIRVLAGSYRGNDVAGKVFELVEQYKETAKGGHVTVKNGSNFPGFPDEVRIKVDSASSYEFVSGGESAVVTAQVQKVPVETDEQVMARIRDRFDILDEMTVAATAGDVRAMIVSGPPGVGKSYGVERQVEKAQMFDTIAGRRLKAEVIKGTVTPVELYKVLYKFSDENCLVVFDDCDSVFADDNALNLLKGALDGGKKRKISWLADSSSLRNEGIPNTFNFNGSVIFISNMKFDNVKGKLKEHTNALQSRCHYLDLTLDTMREKILRIKQVAGDGMLFEDYNFDQATQDSIIEFMIKNQNKLRELSLRMAMKIADLRRAFPARWEVLASTTCMKND